MPSLKGTRTEQNLKDAFAGESRANRRYLCLARNADIEGLKDLAAVLRWTAERKTGRAQGHLDYLEKVRDAAGDPATGTPIGPAGDILEAAIASETHEYIDMYAGMARVAREEGVDDLADWFETLAKAGKWPVDRFRRVLDAL
ncbi:rubrerythrin family protein [Reyranella soli]|uniref:Rubrerythrin n=1 Tax=Reyranella soli TaxID=1230389 RepID=A0A512N4J8_9HYPH|nr:rubrerythrin family protein [Reyranella soli]GEP53883.1 rubrerythrin [Reyranella soli]